LHLCAKEKLKELLKNRNKEKKGRIEFFGGLLERQNKTEGERNKKVKEERKS
jgi:hypothetical protein